MMAWIWIFFEDHAYKLNKRTESIFTYAHFWVDLLFGALNKEAQWSFWAAKRANVVTQQWTNPLLGVWALMLLGPSVVCLQILQCLALEKVLSVKKVPANLVGGRREKHRIGERRCFQTVLNRFLFLKCGWGGDGESQGARHWGS